jgi:hypothetical protein
MRGPESGVRSGCGSAPVYRFSASLEFLGDRRDRIAAADDGRPVHVGHGFRDGDRPLGERVDLEHAHRPVPGDRLRSADDLTISLDRLRTDVEAQPVADGRIVHGQHLGRCAGFELRCDDVIDGQLEAEVPRAGAFFDLARRVEQVVLDERLAHVQPARLEERVRHGAADQQRVDTRHQVLDDLELVRHLRAAENRHERTIGRFQHAPQVLDLCRHQQPGAVLRDVLDDALGRRVRAVGRAERIVDVDVSQRAKAGRKAVVILLLARVEPEILEEEDRPVGCGRAAVRIGPWTRVRDELHGTPKQFRQARRDRLQ